MALQSKVVNYGTTVSVTVLESTKKVLTVVDEQKSEGYILTYHGLDPLPAIGDKGTIVFEKNNGPTKGHWQYYPNKK